MARHNKINIEHTFVYSFLLNWWSNYYYLEHNLWLFFCVFFFRTIFWDVICYNVWGQNLSDGCINFNRENVFSIKTLLRVNITFLFRDFEILTFMFSKISRFCITNFRKSWQLCFTYQQYFELITFREEKTLFSSNKAKLFVFLMHTFRTNNILVTAFTFGLKTENRNRFEIYCFEKKKE